jgi:hypothetical protein
MSEITLDLAARVCRAVHEAYESVQPNRWPTADRVRDAGGWETTQAARVALRGAREAGYVGAEGATYYLTSAGVRLLGVAS